MNNIQDMFSLLPPITAWILLIVAFLTAIIKLIDKIIELWNRLIPAIKYLILLATQIVPVGMVVWYYMYWAVQYNDRFTDRAVFLLLVVEPTIIIIAYELFWGTWLYPKLRSPGKRVIKEVEAPKSDSFENNKKTQDIKPQSKKRSSGG
jgi:hypothetical protein